MVRMVRAKLSRFPAFGGCMSDYKSPLLRPGATTKNQSGAPAPRTYFSQERYRPHPTSHE